MLEEVRIFQLLVKDRLSLLCSGEIFNDTQMIAFSALKVRIDDDRIGEIRLSEKKDFLFYHFFKKIIFKLLFILRVFERPSFFKRKNKFSYLFLRKNSKINFEESELTYLMEFICSYRVPKIYFFCFIVKILISLV
jgi:hypothetical protein